MSDDNGVRNDPALMEALISAYSILSLLHHRGLVDSQFNREDVAKALGKIAPFALAAEREVMREFEKRHPAREFQRRPREPWSVKVKEADQ